jgi:1-acyl-sn-glycerol-3-phosphate acyltransferase
MRKRFGRWLLHVLGWQTRGAFPAGCERCVLVAAPHTSNLDLFFMLAFAMAFELRVRWVGKHTLFRFPLGPVMRALGGIPVDRRLRQDTVTQLATEFARRDRLILVIAPEGTRSHSGYWKSGFYWIAQKAGVPIVPSFLDWGTRTAGFGPALPPGGSLREAMDQMRRVYDGMRGRYTTKLGPVRLEEEGETETASDAHAPHARAANDSARL